MKASRTIPGLLTTCMCVGDCFALIAHNSTAPDLPLIDRLDEAVQHRFEDQTHRASG